jgi:hypothetical protein
MNDAVNSLLSQMESTWKMIEDAIDLIDSDNWLERYNQFSYGQRLYHLIETWEFYIRDDPEGMKWGYLIDLPEDLSEDDWENAFNEKMNNLSPDKLKTYLGEIVNQTRNKLSGLSDQGLINEDGFKIWIPNRITKYIYLIRHSMWHLGELSLHLRMNNKSSIKWQ